MKFCVGFAGGVIGAVLGITSFRLGLTYSFNGDAFGVGLFLLSFGPIALVLGFVGGIIAGLMLLARLKAAQPAVHLARSLAIWAGIPIVFIIAMVAAMNLGWRYPETGEIVSSFHQNRASFEKLWSAPIGEDRITRVSPL